MITKKGIFYDFFKKMDKILMDIENLDVKFKL